MPRLFKEPESIPGLTHPTRTFTDELTIPLGGDRGDLVLRYCGRGHTEGDIVAWLPEHRILFAGDLVEAKAALYTGDAFHQEWSTSTLDTVASFGADQLVGGRGAVARGRDEVDAAIAAEPPLPRGHHREGAARSRAGTARSRRRSTPVMRPWSTSTARGRSSSTRCPSTSRAAGTSCRDRAAGHLDGGARPRGLGPAPVMSDGAGPAGPHSTGRVAVLGNGPVGQTRPCCWPGGASRRPPRPAARTRPRRVSKAICQQRDVLDVWAALRRRRAIADEGLTWSRGPHLLPRRTSSSASSCRTRAARRSRRSSTSRRRARRRSSTRPSPPSRSSRCGGATTSSGSTSSTTTAWSCAARPAPATVEVDARVCRGLRRGARATAARACSASASRGAASPTRSSSATSGPSCPAGRTSGGSTSTPSGTPAGRC